ncbi:MAG: AAA family ATPase [Candidatus Altiarchaeota archaeon]
MALIIGITGKIGAGKTASSAYISEKYNAAVYRFSQILLDILHRLYLEPTRENFQRIGACLRKGINKNVIVDALRKDIEKEKSEIIVIDGIRYLNEVQMLRKFDRNVLLAVDAPLELRYIRCKERNEKSEETKMTLEEFIESERRETERELSTVLKKADYWIDNSGSREELMKKIDEILINLLKD